MKRVIWTLFAGDKYPPTMLHEFCWSLEKYNVVINVALADISDEVARKLYCARGNVSFVRIPEKDYEELLGWRPSGWWWKLLFFAPDLDESILFCDVDTVFTKDPAHIFDYLEERHPPAAFIRDPLYPKVYGTSMFYVNNKAPVAGEIWEQVKVASEQPEGGDQDWLADCIYPEDCVEYLPKEFQGQYKLWGSQEPCWQAALRKHGKGFGDMVSIHFSGRPKADEVLRQGMPHYQEIYDALYWDGR